MEDICPKCGKRLITKTIKKGLGLGSIDYPVAQICPGCNWNRDLIGASNMVPKPVTIESSKIKKDHPKIQPITSPSSRIDKLITVSLAILVLGGLIWAFYPMGLKHTQIPQSTPAPTVTAAPVITATPVPEVTPTGKEIGVELDSYRGFTQKIKPGEIKPGDKIVWTNEGTYPVTLVSNDDLFEARFLDNGKRTSYIFNQSGTYSFYIKENENLNWTIVIS